MKISTLYRFTYIYLALPLFIFLISWLDFGIGLILDILLGYGFYKIYPKDSDETLNLNINTLLLFVIIAFIWCFCGGIGYFYHQPFDYHFRNAVFRDLINFEWPVFYDKANTPMVYYMAFWLIPALVGKLLVLCGANFEGAFLGANVFLLMYAVLGTVLIFVGLVLLLVPNNKVKNDNKEDIKDIRVLRSLLIDSKYMFRDAYIEYMETGKLDFYDKVPIPFILMDSLVPILKSCIGLNKYFSILIDFTDDVSKYTCMSINNYIASRCNGYLSMNVLLDKKNNWKYYYSSNGQFIQDVHDYTEVDCTIHRSRSRNIQK